MPSIDTAITQVAQEFTRQLTLLRSRLSDTYGEHHLALHVAVGHEKVTFSLNYSRGYFSGKGEVQAASLALLVDEVWRRAGFDDKQAGVLQATSDALRALPKPDGETITDDEIPF